jgi:hypothetical protein
VGPSGASGDIVRKGNGGYGYASTFSTSADPDTGETGGGGRFRLPDPTWSVSDLQLDVNHDPISDEELRRLCRRACLLPPRPAGGDTSSLAQDVGNLIHLLEQVRSVDPSLLKVTKTTTTTSLENDGDETEMERARLIYDVPRGVSATPLRDPGEPTSSAENDVDDRADRDRVTESLLRPNMTAVGGHCYFAVQTGEPDSSSPSKRTKKRDD